MCVSHGWCSTTWAPRQSQHDTFDPAGCPRPSGLGSVPDLYQVEQDLLLSLSMRAIFDDPSYRVRRPCGAARFCTGTSGAGLSLFRAHRPGGRRRAPGGAHQEGAHARTSSRFEKGEGVSVGGAALSKLTTSVPTMSSSFRSPDNCGRPMARKFAEQAQTLASRLTSVTTAFQAPLSDRTERGRPVFSQEVTQWVRT